MKEDVKQAVAELKAVNKKLDAMLALDEKTGSDLNKKLDEVIGIVQKPENRIARSLELAAAIAGVFSILSIVEIIRSWLGQ